MGVSSSSSSTGGGNLDVKAMIGEAKRRSDQRQKRDRQYLHRSAFAAVRVAPLGSALPSRTVPCRATHPVHEPLQCTLSYTLSDL